MSNRSPSFSRVPHPSRSLRDGWDSTLKIPSKSACQPPRTSKIPLTNTVPTTSPRKILGIVVMLRLVQLTYRSKPKSSFWHSPRSRHSALSAEPGSPASLLAGVEEPGSPASLLAGAEVEGQNLRIWSVAPLHFRNSPQVVPNDDFIRNSNRMTTLAASSREIRHFSPVTRMFRRLYP
jgi:hypothetical protein